MITGDGKSEVELESRIKSAWKAFWANKNILLNRKSPVKMRIKAMEQLWNLRYFGVLVYGI